MSFGNRKQAPSPAMVLDWRGVGEFEITTALHRGAKLRGKDHGRLAVRVPVPTEDGRKVTLVPCAFFAQTVTRSLAASRAFVDEAATQVLLAMEKSEQAEGEVHYLVRDASGADVGTIRRIPPDARWKRHGWQIEQPGHPPLEASRQWFRRRPHGRAFVADAIASVAGLDEGGDFSREARTLVWQAGDERVMTSQADGPVVIEADWFDRRLAIAYAMLLDR